MSKINITNIFSIGYRCNACEFLDKYLKIRKYSSPFSYMVIDVQTALHFIDTEFKDYVNLNLIKNGNNTFKFNNNLWSCNHVHYISEIDNDYVDILDMNHVCIWVHHDLNKISTINSMIKRSRHLLHSLNTCASNTLLFYIEKLQVYGEKDSYFDISILSPYNCKFLIIIPLLNLKTDPILYYDNDNIKIIYFDSNKLGWSADPNCQGDWEKLVILINKLYDFKIEPRDNEIDIL